MVALVVVLVVVMQGCSGSGYCSNSVTSATAFNQKADTLRERYYVLTQIPAVAEDAITTANIPAYQFKSVTDAFLLSTRGALIKWLTQLEMTAKTKSQFARSSFNPN